MMLYVDAISDGVENLGPGRRIGLWVQGCTLGCPGCMSPELFHRREECALPVTEVARQILARSPGHDGLTISGGEPFQQARALCRMLSMVHRHWSADVLVYSGYSIAEILDDPRGKARLLTEIDMLMDGRFEVSHENTRLWRGSDNQRLHILTPRAECHRWAQEAAYPGERTMQYEFSRDGRLRLIGIPERGFDRLFVAKTRTHGLELRRGVRR